MRRPIFLSLAITVVCAFPVFLLGALSIQMRGDLGFSLTMLGLFIAVFRGSGALVAVPLGRLADRIGPASSMRIAALIAAVAAAGTAGLARSPVTLVVFLIVAGTANALGQASANLTLARGVEDGKQGMAFGLKQSALPIGALLAGLTVPLLAVTVGWRWAFALAAVAASAVAIAAQSDHSKTPTIDRSNRRGTTGSTRLGLLTTGMLFAMAAATSLPAFTVEAAASSGLREGLAGLLLTAGSLCAVAVRLTAGSLADRRGGRHLQVVSRMIAAGVIGFLLLSLDTVWALILGTFIAFGLGWGFNGVFWFAVVRLNDEAPGRASATVMVGGMIGGLVGPITFGWLADTFGYPTSWRVAALWAAIGAATIHLARRQILADSRVVAGTTSTEIEFG
ncbi:MAG: MFS transporter [Acidimicrobiia bacterium]|nr:MFS transporter [Acidimicrobiia bacterium]